MSLASTLPKDLIHKILNTISPEIFSNIHSIQPPRELYQYALINRNWCDSIVPLLWKRPFHQNRRKKINLTISLYLACATDQELREMNQVGYIKSLRIKTKPIYDYPHFICDLNYTELFLATKFFVARFYKITDNVQFLLKTLFRIMFNHGAVLESFKETELGIPKPRIWQLMSDSQDMYRWLQSVKTFEFVDRNPEFLLRIFAQFQPSVPEIESLVAISARAKEDGDFEDAPDLDYEQDEDDEDYTMIDTDIIHVIDDQTVFETEVVSTRKVKIYLRLIRIFTKTDTTGAGELHYYGTKLYKLSPCIKSMTQLRRFAIYGPFHKMGSISTILSQKKLSLEVIHFTDITFKKALFILIGQCSNLKYIVFRRCKGLANSEHIKFLVKAELLLLRSVIVDKCPEASPHFIKWAANYQNHRVGDTWPAIQR
ncbi:hypothetical protein G9A89_010194 [Geosiphon pyriformis]|nr:hypothetical protein G9A89_010194 [Geosiphon pyriformis]